MTIRGPGLALALTLTTAFGKPPVQTPGGDSGCEQRLMKKAIHPVVRAAPAPSGGRPVTVNPPPLLWPPACDQLPAAAR